MDTTHEARGTEETVDLSLEVRSAADAAAALDELIATDDEASLAHEPRVLEVIGRTLRQRTEVLVARRGSRVVGALPLVCVRGPLGATDSSVAALDRGGPIGSLEGRAALVRFAACRAMERGAALELRSPRPVDAFLEGDPALAASLQVSRAKDTLICPLSSGDPEQIAKALDAKTRNQLRKALREGLHSETVVAEPGAIRAFHDIYSRTMRDLGSPPHGATLFLELAKALGERARIARVRDDSNRVVASAFLLDDRHGRTVLPWAASDRRLDGLEPNTLLYHELLWDSVIRGRRELDLGRSTRDGPAFKFKLRWGASPHPLYWTTVAPPGARRAPTGADKERGGMRFAVATWKRLPLPLARALGPLLTRWLAA